jgi:thioesterase domain-containing protein
MLAEGAPDVDVRPLTFDKVMEVLRSRGNALLMLDEHYFPAVFKVYKNNLHAWIDFAPDRFQGDLLLLTAADQAEGSATPDAWLPYVDGTIETHAIDSSHRNMTQLGPLAQIGAILAAKLSQISEG